MLFEERAKTFFIIDTEYVFFIRVKMVFKSSMLFSKYLFEILDQVQG